MSKKVKYYVSLLSIISAAILIYSVYSFCIQNTSLPQLLFFIILAALCESFVVYISEERAVSVTYAILLAAQLTNGAAFSALVAAGSVLFSVIRTPKGKLNHLFSRHYIKTAFNVSSYSISAFFAGTAYSALLHTTNFSTPEIRQICFLIVYIFVYFVFNSSFISMLSTLQYNEPFKYIWVKSTFWALPNFMALTPLGFLVYILFTLKENGYWYILLLLLPLFLARYSFKLYLDYKNQYFKTVQVLSAAIEAKDPYTVGHSRRVEYYAEAIARRMGLPQAKIDGLKVAALLHDIGKIGIEDSILRKPGSLSESEWERMQKHPALGVHILEDIAFPYNVKYVIRHHHERYDGTGYPDGCKGNEATLEAYILAAADAYDAMSSDRPYRSALDKERIMAIFKAEAGAQFEPHVAAVILEMLERGMLTYPEDNNR